MEPPDVMGLQRQSKPLPEICDRRKSPKPSSKSSLKSFFLKHLNQTFTFLYLNKNIIQIWSHMSEHLICNKLN